MLYENIMEESFEIISLFDMIYQIWTCILHEMKPRKYWSDLKQKLISEGYTEVSDTIGQLKMMAEDGKMRLTS